MAQDAKKARPSDYTPAFNRKEYSGGIRVHFFCPDNINTQTLEGMSPIYIGHVLAMTTVASTMCDEFYLAPLIGRDISRDCDEGGSNQDIEPCHDNCIYHQ